MTPRPVVAHVTVEGRKWASMNGSRGNHHAHQALMNEWLALGMAAIRAAHLKPIDAPVVITATVHRTTAAKADAHNVTPTIKAGIDALVKCGVIEDDHDGIVKRLVIEAGPKAKKPTIELEVRSA